ncbi:MAG: transposase [Alphaproteobacteria bacterium]|nr:transposase [Alphaproteobacteria bacterium]
MNVLFALETENTALREDNARLKGLKGRPKLKPSGMEEGTNRPQGKGKRKKERAKRRSPVVNEEHKLSVDIPAGSRFKGYDDFVVQDLRLEGRVIRYRRERWLTPEGKLLVAPLPAGLRGHFGPELVRFILLQHHQGQVTTDRIVQFLNALGLSISKRQVLRLLSDDVGVFCDEANGVLRAGLESADWITVDDTGARHRNRNGVTTQIGDDRFTFFKTTFSKSRKNFLELLRAGYQDYVINAEALAYMRERHLAAAVIEQLDKHAQRTFADETAWSDHLDQLGISQLPHAGSGVHPDPIKIATEGALWGSIQAHGHLQNTVIVSDGAGQFRLDDHADCWIHAERLVHKLDSFNDEQRRAVEIERELIWWLYRDLKLYKKEPSRKRAAQLKARFKRIFSRKTGFAPLDRLLARLLDRIDDLLRVLDRPEIPLHTNGSENDIRCHVTKRKISGGTRSEAGRDARDAFLGLMKTCQKLGVSFFDYLGHRLDVQGVPTVPPLPDLVIAAKA